MNVLVVCKGRYIGSHITKLLIRLGDKTGVIDNFSQGFRNAVRSANVFEVDLAN